MSDGRTHTGLADEPIHDVLRRILEEADEPLTMDEIEDRLLQRIQAGVRGLKATGEWRRHSRAVEQREVCYSIRGGTTMSDDDTLSDCLVAAIKGTEPYIDHRQSCKIRSGAGPERQYCTCAVDAAVERLDAALRRTTDPSG